MCRDNTKVVMSSGAMTTRGQKRRRGARDSLWDVIVKNDDICFQHILPKLNATDVKFLHAVNKEARKLVKRSSRKGELKKTFDIGDMSSISTLEVAWEHYPWGTYDRFMEEEMDETYFCMQVAYTNKLELLKWAREEKKCEWDEKTINAAAKKGNMEMVKYCVANECPIDTHTCSNAAGGGHLECLKYLREEVKAPWDSDTAYLAADSGQLHILEYLVERKYDEYCKYACEGAAMNGHFDCLKYLHETAKAPWDSGTASLAALSGHLHILEYLVERKYDKYNAWACVHAARHGHLDCLKYLHETAKVRWDYMAVREAHDNNQIDCLQYLLDNNCPLPEGWRYEDGEVHASYY